ncbi:MbnP family protein [Winogradskyella sediminis]|uniref:MbnP family protein n=1 Tax=Winogradskyella sediminis TaxID=1382466 RepID=UPI003AA8AB06
MKHLKKYILLTTVIFAFLSCSSDDENRVANNVTLEFSNTFNETPLVLGDASSSTATINTSDAGQVHHFSELKYVISNIRLIKANGDEIPYNINDLDNGATVVDQSKPETLNYVLNEIPVGDYTEIKFGLGVRSDLNNLDEVSFPTFYNNAGANDTQMHWEWGTGYRFTKIEGFYDTDNMELSFHSGSTLEGEEGNYTQGVDAYRDITLELPTTATVGSNAPIISIKADFHYLLSGNSHTITLVSTEDISNNATPSTHTATEMEKFVDNIGGNGTTDLSGMFSVTSVEN